MKKNILYKFFISFFASLIICFFTSCPQIPEPSKVSSSQYIKVVSVSSDSVTLSWNFNTDLLNYDIFISTSDSILSAYVCSKGISKKDAIISGLESSTKYYFWVKAYGLENITYVSDMVSATTLVGAPESVEIIFDDNDLKLIWDVVPEATSYKVYYGNSSSIDDAVEDFVYSANLSTDYISKTYSNVATNDDVYYVWIYGKNEKIVSSYSAMNMKRKGFPDYKFYYEEAPSYSEDNYSLMEKSNGTKVFMLKTNNSRNVISKEKTGTIKNISDGFDDITEEIYPVFNVIGKKISRQKEFTEIQDSVSPIKIDHKLSCEFKHFDINEYSSSKINSRSSEISDELSNDNFVSYKVGDTRTFFVDDADGNFSRKTAVLTAEGNYSYVWILDEVYSNSSEQNDDNKLTQDQIKLVANKFDEIYGPATTIFGETYKSFYQNSSAGNIIVKPEEKISILICDIFDDYTPIQKSGVVGYFWAKDFYDDEVVSKSNLRSNECEIFYIDSYFLDAFTEMSYSTLAHEFQHMLNFVNKELKFDLYPSTWYNEMLSLICEDLLQDIIGIKDKDSPRSRLHSFNYGYLLNGFNEWLKDDKVSYSYAHAYALGAFITRNFGGASLIKEMASNSEVNLDSIISSIKTIADVSDSYSEKELLFDFARGLCYPEGFEGSESDETTLLGKAKRAELKHFYRGNSYIIGDYEFTLRPIRLADYPFFYYNNKNQVRHSFAPYLFSPEDIYELRPYGFTIHSFGTRTDNFVFDYESPSSSNVKIYFVIQ